nr:histone deacetylase 14 isoform X1 [Ipomoea batatas]
MLNAKLEKGYSLESVRGRINCLNKPESDGSSPPQTIGSGAKVIYAAAPALGHNKESHPECNSRVSAILNALEKMELNSKV